MILELKRKGKLITETAGIDMPPMYAGTILVHELAVRCPLYEGEALCVSYADGSGKPLTKAQMLMDKRRYEDSGGGIEYHIKIPNIVMQEGDKRAYISILDVYQPVQDANADQKYKVVTSAFKAFTVFLGPPNMDFEPMDESLELEILRKVEKISGLLQAPDNSEANKIGTVEVTIMADGRLKFKNLKGESGENGSNAVIAWGINNASPLSTVAWKKL